MLVHSVESTGTTCFLPVVYVKDKAVDAVGITGGGLHPTTERWTIHLLDIHGTIIIMASLEVVSTLPLNLSLIHI